jgi:exodeoxyribonuclease-3
MGGDFNVIPEARDAADPAAWVDDALFRLETRRRFRALTHLGLTDSWRALNPTATGYSFWDYQGQAWQADNGIRIDHLLASPEIADRLEACIIDREPRGRDKASDHTPVVATLSE